MIIPSVARDIHLLASRRERIAIDKGGIFYGKYV